MNADGLNALVIQLGCEFDGDFIATDETAGKDFDDFQYFVFKKWYEAGCPRLHHLSAHRPQLF